MTGNRLLRNAMLFLALVAPGGAFAAEGSTPALAGVGEVVLQYPKLSNSKSSESCGFSADTMMTDFLKVLKGYSVPASSVINAKPPMIGTARIELLPEIVTINSQGTECTSWVALTAQSRNTLNIPPIPNPRTVMVTYWRGGLLISSGVVSHPRAMSEAFEKLARQFGQQFRLDQPPPVPKLDEP